jgi:hypothetical protein
MSGDLSDTIEQVAKTGKRVTVDGLTVEFATLEELLKADAHLKASSARSKNHLGLTFRKLEPPGAG